jgi:tripartite-type tricarboxylate transporter receptor subunit TctC
MVTRRQILGTSAALGSSIVFGAVRTLRAQTVQKVTRIVVGLPPGSFVDTVLRLLINQMRGYAPTIILENRPGAGFRIAIEAVKNSASDGSTILLSPSGPLVLYPHLFKALSYKPLDDFIPVTTVYSTPSALAVGPMVGGQVTTVADFVAWCRANPKQSSYGSPGAGSPMHFLGTMLARAAGFEFLHVPYQGSGPATQDVAGGQIASAIGPVPNMVQLMQPGRLRVLATTGAARSAALPDVPTMKEAGFPTLEFAEWFGLLLPAKTPMPIATALNIAVHDVLNTDEFKNALAKLSLEPSGMSISEFAQRMKDDTQRWQPIVQASGFVAE